MTETQSGISILLLLGKKRLHTLGHLVFVAEFFVIILWYIIYFIIFTQILHLYRTPSITD